MADEDRSRKQVVEAIALFVNLLGWRIRAGDDFFIVLLPPLARGNPDRNRWKDEPEEGFEPRLRDRLGGFDADHD